MLKNKIQNESSSEIIPLLKINEIFIRKFQILDVLKIDPYFERYAVFDMEKEEILNLKIFKVTFENNPSWKKIYDRDKRIQRLNLSSFFLKEELNTIDYTYPFILSEFIAWNNQGLLNLRENIKRLSLFDKIRILIQICEAMSFFERTELRYHGNLNSTSIYLTKNDFIKIKEIQKEQLFLPFNLSVYYSFFENDINGLCFQSRNDFGFGTPNYSPPENYYIKNEINIKCDIYSFGILAFEMISDGKYPFDCKIIRNENEFMSSWEKNHHIHLNNKVPGLSSPFMSVIYRCLEKQVENRYNHFSEIKNDLGNLYKSIFSKEYIPINDEIIESSNANNKGNCLFEYKKIKESLQFYQRALKLNRENYHAIVDFGNYFESLEIYPDAITYYNQALEIQPLSTDILTKKAICLWKSGKIDESVIIFDKLLKINDKDDFVYKNMSLMFQDLSQYNESLNYINHAIKINSKNIEYLIIKAQNYYYLNNINESIKYFKKIISKDKDNIIALIGLYKCLIEESKNEEATEFWHKVYKINPLFHELYFTKGVSLFKKESYIEAIKYLDESIRLCESFYDAYLLKSECHERLNKFEDAKKSLDLVLVKKPYLIKALFLKSKILFESDSVREAGEIIETALKYSPEVHFIWELKGDILFKVEKFEEAMESYKKAYSIFENIDILNKIGNCLLVLGQKENAKEFFQNALKMNSKNANANLGLAKSFYSMNNYEKCLHYLDIVIKLDPSIFEAYVYKGDSLKWLKNYELAIEEYKRAFNLKPRDLHVIKKIGGTYYQLERYDEAKEYFSQVILKDEDDYMSYVYLAYLENRANNTKKSLEMINKVHEISERKTIPIKVIKELNELFIKINLKVKNEK